MEILKTRKQGNEVVIPVPSSFNIAAGIPFRPKLTSRGIFYEYTDDREFFDFDEEILKDLISQGLNGQELLTEFRRLKATLPKAMDKLLELTEQEANTAQAMTREQFLKEIGL